MVRMSKGGMKACIKMDVARCGNKYVIEENGETEFIMN